MTKTYEPGVSPTYTVPFIAIANGDNLGQEVFWDSLMETTIFDNIQHVKDRTLENATIGANHRIKTGFTVANINDNQKDTFTGTSFLNGQNSAKDCLLLLDTQAGLRSTDVSNIKTVLGVSDLTALPPWSTDYNLVATDTFFSAVSKLDQIIDSTSNAISTNTGDISSLQSTQAAQGLSITSLLADMDAVKTDDNGFSYRTNAQVLVDGESVVQNLNSVDTFLEGSRNHEKDIREELIETWRGSLTTPGVFEEVYYALFYDKSEDSFQTSISQDRYNLKKAEYEGQAGDLLYFTNTFTANIDFVQLKVLCDNPANLVVNLNLIGSTNDIQMQGVTLDTPVDIVTNGASLVLKFEFIGPCNIREVRVAGRRE